MYNRKEIELILKKIDIIATDVDDTLTINGFFKSNVLKAIEHINKKGKKIILVTGRSGGACTTLSQYLPVEMVIAENGGVIIKGHDIKIISLPSNHKERLQGCYKAILDACPGIIQAEDNPFRLTDLSIDNRSINEKELNIISNIAKSFGFTIVISSVQTHILSPTCSKGSTLKKLINGNKVLTIGDSSNDESMFNPRIFPYSVGVANIKSYLSKMKYKPRWIMSQSEGYGFIELVSMI